MSAIQHYDPAKGLLTTQLKVEEVYTSPQLIGNFTRYERIWMGTEIYQIQKKTESMRKPVYIMWLWDQKKSEPGKLLETDISERTLQQFALLYVGKSIASTPSSVDDLKTRTLLASKRP